MQLLCNISPDHGIFYNSVNMYASASNSCNKCHLNNIMQCLRGQSLNAFFEGIQSNPVKLAVVGCGCSTATEPVAEISHHWNISQVIIIRRGERLIIVLAM